VDSKDAKAYDFLRVVLAMVLLAAAVFKAVDLTDRPVEVGFSLSSHWVLALTIQVELAVGLLLLVGLWKGLVAPLAAALFAGFACVSAYKVLAGEPSCGCSGSFPVPPEYMLAVHVAAAGALILFRPSWRRASAGDARVGLRAVLFAVGMVGGTALLLWSVARWRPVFGLYGCPQPGSFLFSVGRFAGLAPSDWGIQTPTVPVLRDAKIVSVRREFNCL
jgi:hypothetical protein